MPSFLVDTVLTTAALLIFTTPALVPITLPSSSHSSPIPPPPSLLPKPFVSFLCWPLRVQAYPFLSPSTPRTVSTSTCREILMFSARLPSKRVRMTLISYPHQHLTFCIASRCDRGLTGQRNGGQSGQGRIDRVACSKRLAIAPWSTALDCDDPSC